MESNSEFHLENTNFRSSFNYTQTSFFKKSNKISINNTTIITGSKGKEKDENRAAEPREEVIDADGLGKRNLEQNEDESESEASKESMRESIVMHNRPIRDRASMVAEEERKR